MKWNELKNEEQNVVGHLKLLQIDNRGKVKLKIISANTISKAFPTWHIGGGIVKTLPHKGHWKLKKPPTTKNTLAINMDINPSTYIIGVRYKQT